jgi:4-hydroxybenzoate polyprenyltransferase
MLRAMLRLTRLGTSLLGFVAVFLPSLVRTHDLWMSFGRAIPLLFACVCTFIANDLDDVEIDRVNHPWRPLPAGHLTPTVAGIMFFTSLFLSILTTKCYVPPSIAFWYYTFIIISISYGYTVKCFPSFKPPHVATAGLVLVLIVTAWYPNETRLYIVASSLFLITVGREICLDIRDRAGDAVNFMHRFNPRVLGFVGFCLEAAGLLLLVIQLRQPQDVAALLGMALMLALAAFYWFKVANYRRATLIMKMLFVVGLYFLI